MTTIGMPQQLLTQGVGGPGGGPGPTMPQAMMPQGMPGLPAGGIDPQRIMAYIQALRGGVGGMPGGAPQGGGGGGGLQIGGEPLSPLKLSPFG